MIVRDASVEDADRIAGIYAPYVRETAISFETHAPDRAEMQRRIEATVTRYPYLVCEIDGVVQGYAYGSAYRTRPAYAHSVEVSAYVSRENHRSGMGRALYTELLTRLHAMDFHMAIAIITLPNDESMGFHKSMGFEEIGVLREIGYKFGQWYDTCLCQRKFSR